MAWHPLTSCYGYSCRPSSGREIQPFSSNGWTIRFFNLENECQGRWGFGWKVAGEGNLSTSKGAQKLALLGSAVCMQYNHAYAWMVWAVVITPTKSPSEYFERLWCIFGGGRTHERTNKHTTCRHTPFLRRRNGVEMSFYQSTFKITLNLGPNHVNVESIKYFTKWRWNRSFVRISTFVKK